MVGSRLRWLGEVSLDNAIREGGLSTLKQTIDLEVVIETICGADAAVELTRMY